jgi:murein DD-endopeptidase MepM/ murein hydrolase activator NlpD
MKKEIQVVLAGALFLNSCAPIVAKAVSPETATQDPEKTFYDPTATVQPTPTHNPDYDYLFAISPSETVLPSRTPLPEPTITITPSPEFEAVVETCILPFTGATLDGLQYRGVIYNNGLPVTEEDGTIHRHLGLDFEGGYEGVPISNICDGEIVFSGQVKEGWGLNLGNIVVMKYRYEEDGEIKTAYMRYAHMENVTDLPAGTKIKKGTKIGEMGHSGGWPEENVHLHIDLWKEKAWDRIVVERSGGDLKETVGYYAQGEIWSDNNFESNLIDPKKWLQERLK